MLKNHILYLWLSSILSLLNSTAKLVSYLIKCAMDSVCYKKKKTKMLTYTLDNKVQKVNETIVDLLVQVAPFRGGNKSSQQRSFRFLKNN